MSRGPGRLAPLALMVPLLAAACEQSECPDCFPSGYLIDLSAAPSGTNPPPAVLFSGYRNGRCQDDLICTGSPDAHLGDLEGKVLNWWTSCGDEDREMVVFAGGHAPTALHPAAGSVGFTPTLGSAATLQIAAWVIQGADPIAVTRDQVEDELALARQIFEDLGTGIGLEYSITDFPAPAQAALTGITSDASCDLYSDLGGGGPASSAIQGNVVQDPARLNVYFVRSLRYANDGLICFDPADLKSKPYVIFVDAELPHAPSTLAHELGHALGMLVAASMPGNTSSMYPGDVNELQLDPYLATDNLMTSGVTHVGHIALGQIYRMHFDERSWLRRGIAAADGYPRECQADPVDGGPCPPLSLHPPRGWP